MAESGIDWDHYDHGPGSEEYRRKMAADTRGYHNRIQTERRRQIQRLTAKAASRAATAKRLGAVIQEIATAACGPYTYATAVGEIKAVIAKARSNE